MPTRLNIVYEPGLTPNPSIAPLLELLRSQTHADGTYVYRLCRGESKLELLTWHGVEPTRIGRYEAESRAFFPPTQNPLQVGEGAWRDARLEHFPEFLQNRFEFAISIALRDSTGITGLVNVCWFHNRPAQRGTEFITSLSTAIGALVSGEQLAEELAATQRKLADRKLLDRAKGILQSKFLWTEEKAYLEMRRTSRRKRIRMGEIARHVISHAELPYHAGGAAYGD